MKLKHWIFVGAAVVLAVAPILQGEHLPAKVAAVVAALVSIAGTLKIEALGSSKETP